MASPSGLLEVGRITKAHGLRGEVAVKFTTDRIEERTAPGTILVVNGEEKKIESARPAGDRWLIRFVGVNERNQAELLNSALVYAEPIDDPQAIFIHQVIGARLVDQHDTDHGAVVAVVANPASDLLELEDGRLVPFAFVQAVREPAVATDNNRRVHVEVPAGLLDDQ